MSLLRILRQALSGALLVNAIPHTVHGVSGQSFPTPFADPPGRGLSTPAANVGWGLANAVAGALLHRHSTAASSRLAFAAGAIGMGVLLARYFGSLPVLARRRRRSR